MRCTSVDVKVRFDTPYQCLLFQVGHLYGK